MKLNKYLASRLKEVLTEGKWVAGTNFKAEITDLNWKQATQQIDNNNTLADLTFHIDYYIAGVTQVLKGGALEISDKHSFDYLTVQSEKDWNQLVKKFCADSEEIIKVVEQMPEEKLQSDFANHQYGTVYRNIDVMIEHAYYHLGQIILLKKHIK